MPVGVTKENTTDPYVVSASPSATQGHVIPFTLIATGDGGFLDTLNFNITVYTPLLTYLSHTVMNGTGVLLPGQTSNLAVTIKNIGNEIAPNVTSVLMTTSPYITINDHSGNYGTINPGITVTNTSDPYNITASPSTPQGHSINFSLTIQSGTYTDTLDFTLVAGQTPILTYQSHTVINSSGILFPGETADLLISLQNIGGAVAQNVTATLMESSPYITINDNSGSFGTINPGAIASNSSNPYNITAHAATPYSTPVDFSIIVQAGSYTDTLTFTLIVGQLVPSDSGYYYAYYSGGSYIYAPVFEWFAIDTTQSANPGISLDLHRNQTAVVNLPFIFRYYGMDYDRISICSNGWIAMDSTASTDFSNSTIPNLDGPPAMIAGLWDFLEPGNVGMPSDIYYYYDTPHHRFIIEYFRVEHCPRDKPETSEVVLYPLYYQTFQVVLYDPVYHPTPTGDGEIIAQYLLAIQKPCSSSTIGIENSTQTIGIEYYFNNIYDSLAIPISDSFAIKYTTYAPDHPPGVVEYYESNQTLSTTKLSIYPSITKEFVIIHYQLANLQSNVEIKVYEATGRLVKKFKNLTVHPFNQIIWYCRDDHTGRRVNNGVYFVQLEADCHKQVEKIILMQ